MLLRDCPPQFRRGVLNWSAVEIWIGELENTRPKGRNQRSQAGNTYPYPIHRQFSFVH
jgi:hypothetical protein